MSYLRSPLLLFLLLLLTTVAAHAAERGPADSALLARITAIVEQQNQRQTGGRVKQSVTLLTPSDKIAALCSDPQLRVPESKRLTGNRSIAVQCGRKRSFIQVNIQAEGTYWVAARPLKPGQTLGNKDIHPRKGPLDALPAGLVLSGREALGAVTTRTIRSGQPLTRYQLRKPWQATTGQDVEVISIGEGFQIRVKGKALDNAAVNQPLRVRLRSGQIISGIMSSSGTVQINPES